LVNNAGITRDGAAMRMSDENWEAVISTNLTGTHNFCKASIRYLRKANGAIVNISSISGQIGNIGQTNYCAAKGGVIAYTKALAIEYPGLRCTAICPGFINTDMTARLPSDVWKYATAKTKLKRAGEPWEIAQAVVRSATAYGNTYAPCAVVTVAGGWSWGARVMGAAGSETGFGSGLCASGQQGGRHAAGRLFCGVRPGGLRGRAGRLPSGPADAPVSASCS
jgi:3-oxoacyl-[acyl-carrier protein] reductase